VGTVVSIRSAAKAGQSLSRSPRTRAALENPPEFCDLQVENLTKETNSEMRSSCCFVVYVHTVIYNIYPVTIILKGGLFFLFVVAQIPLKSRMFLPVCFFFAQVQ